MLYKPVEAGCAAGLRKRTATEGSVEPWMMFDTVSLLQPETWIVGSGLRLFAARPKKTLETHSPRPREAGHGGRRWYGSTFFQRAPSFRKNLQTRRNGKKTGRVATPPIGASTVVATVQARHQDSKGNVAESTESSSASIEACMVDLRKKLASTQMCRL